VNITEEQYTAIVSEIEDKQTANEALHEITKCLNKIAEFQIGDRKMSRRMNKLWLAICDLQEEAEKELELYDTTSIPFSHWSYAEQTDYIREKALES